MPELLHKELSYQIQKCFFNTRNKYGMNHKEIIFHRALGEEFDVVGIPYISQPRINIHSLTTGKIIGTYVPDYLVKNLIIIEIKAALFTTKQMEMQLCEYLKTSEYELGYLTNFGENEFKPRRFIYTNDRKPFLISEKKISGHQ